MRRTGQLVFSVSVAILVSLAVTLSAAAKGPPPNGPQLPFSFSSTPMTFNCDGVTEYGGLTCAANTPFTVNHSVVAGAATRQDANQLAKATDSGFQLSVDGQAPPSTGSSTKVTKNNDGTFSVDYNDWYNFTGLTGTHTLTFTFVSGGSTFFTVTETYIFS
jgi:hypothetical protein